VADESHTSHLLNLADLEGSDLDNLLGDLNIPAPTHSIGEEEKLSEDCFIDDDSLMRHLIDDPNDSNRPCIKEAFLNQKENIPPPV
jgi:hypothetical protein